MRPYRLLIVTYFWPPFSGPGSARWLALVKYLRRMGHEVTVVTTSAFGPLPADGPAGVTQTRDLAAVGGLRKMLRRPPVEEQSSVGAALQKPAPGVLTRVLVPDSYLVSWVPFAVAATRRILREGQIDCVITSSPPDSVHLTGLALGRRRPAWIADFRDGWTFEPLRRPFPTGPQRWLDRRLERAVARSADMLVGATEPIARDLSGRYEVESTTIRNAWDPDLESAIEAARPPDLEPDRVNLVYTGSLGGMRGHDDRGLLAALRGVVRDDPDLAGRLRLVIAGPLTESEQGALSAPDLSPVVRLVGVLPYPEALALQRKAEALLLVTSNDSSVSTAKIYEYLAANRPILAVAGANEAARIVAETGTGVTIAPDDVPGIRGALAELVAGKLEGRYDSRLLERYRYPAPAEALAETIDRAVDRHRRGG